MSIKGIGEVVIIKTGDTSVAVDSHGAKVLSILVGDRELLFYDENDIGHSGIPLCFPSFGPLKDNMFISGDKSYPMNQHGFIRDSAFTLEKEDEGLLTCRFCSNEETLKHYPFSFEFVVNYRVIKGGVAIRFQFTNCDDKDLPLAPGVHPYFAVADKSAVSFTSGAVSGNDNSDEFALKLIEDCDVFAIKEELNNGLREIAIKGAPDMHLANHNLNTTLIATGHEKGIVMDSDVEAFNRMTVWRKTEDVAYICVEPSFTQNGLNDEPLVVPAGETFETVVSIVLNR